MRNAIKIWKRGIFLFLLKYKDLRNAKLKYNININIEIMTNSFLIIENKNYNIN